MPSNERRLVDESGSKRTLALSRRVRDLSSTAEGKDNWSRHDYEIQMKDYGRGSIRETMTAGGGAQEAGARSLYDSGDPEVRKSWRRYVKDSLIAGDLVARWKVSVPHFAWTTRETYVVPLLAGQILPRLPDGGISSVRMTAIPAAKRIPELSAFVSDDPSVYAFMRQTSQRNIYRVPVP
jgi:hypothetical protein